MAAAKDKHTPKIRNKKATHKYTLGEKFEAGLALLGTEIKSIRQGKAQINEAFIRIDKKGAILYHAYIDEYKFGTDNNHNPTRPRRLLLHERELNKIRAAIQREGFSCVPVKIYFKGRWAKIEIALGKGKKLFDRREALKKQTALREAEKAIKFSRR